LTHRPTTTPHTATPEEHSDEPGVVLVAVTLVLVCLITAAWGFGLVTLARWLIGAIF
jgi:hypothetical protein